MSDHRAEAERLLAMSDEVAHRSDALIVLAHRVAQAQVHAILAMADAWQAVIAKLEEDT